MANTPFQSLSAQDRRDALEVAASLSGRRAHLLEKDIWVVQILSVLFDAPFGRDLVFKGGTSLAKAYHVIRRVLPPSSVGDPTVTPVAARI